MLMLLVMDLLALLRVPWLLSGGGALVVIDLGECVQLGLGIVNQQDVLDAHGNTLLGGGSGPVLDDRLQQLVLGEGLGQVVL